MAKREKVLRMPTASIPAANAHLTAQPARLPRHKGPRPVPRGHLRRARRRLPVSQAGVAVLGKRVVFATVNRDGGCEDAGEVTIKHDGGPVNLLASEAEPRRGSLYSILGLWVVVGREKESTATAPPAT